MSAPIVCQAVRRETLKINLALQVVQDSKNNLLSMEKPTRFQLATLLTLFFGTIALGCSGPDEDITPLDYYEDEVDIQDIRVGVAIVPRRAGYPNIRITVGGAFDLNCPSSFEVYTKYRLEENHLFIRLFVGSGDETCFNDPNPRPGNVSGEVYLHLPVGEYTVFQEGKPDGNPLIVFRVEADKVILSKNKNTS